MAGRQVGRQGAAGLGLGCKGGHVPWGLVEPALGAISLALSAGVGSLGSGRSKHPSLPRYPPPIPDLLPAPSMAGHCVIYGARSPRP